MARAWDWRFGTSRKIAEQFLTENFKWIDVSREIIFKTAEIRRQRKTKTLDAIMGQQP